MSRAYVLIAIPAVVVGIFYLAIFHSLGMPVHAAPFLGAAAVFATAIFFVRRYQRKKARRPGA